MLPLSSVSKTLDCCQGLIEFHFISSRPNFPFNNNKWRVFTSPFVNPEKERLSKTNARIIPKAVFGIIGVALSFWFVMFLKQFDQEKKKK
jgi:hypothetical protein